MTISEEQKARMDAAIDAVLEEEKGKCETCANKDTCPLLNRDYEALQRLEQMAFSIEALLG